MIESFEKMLTGGHPNSLGRTIEVVDTILANPARFDELFQCYFSKDEVVRLRVSNAMKRICKVRKELLLPYLDRFLTEISQINQASTQWTLAQLFLMLEKDLSVSQKAAAQQIMQDNLAQHNDWIVLSQSMETLTRWSQNNEALKGWLLLHLERLSIDSRKSVAKKAAKSIAILQRQ